MIENDIGTSACFVLKTLKAEYMIQKIKGMKFVYQYMFQDDCYIEAEHCTSERRGICNINMAAASTDPGIYTLI